MNAKTKNKRIFSLLFPVVIFLLIVAAFSLMTNGRFLGNTVITGIFNQSLIVGTIAIGVSHIYSIGELDFSVGAAMGLAATLGALVYQATGSIILMIVVDIGCAILLLLFNCALSVTFKLMSAMVAVVAMSLYSAVTQGLIGSTPIKIDYAICKTLEGGYRYVIFAAYFILCLALYHGTAIGRTLRFIGGNAVCAKQTGINVAKNRYVAFLMAGIGVGIAATFSTIRSASLDFTVGQGLGMDVMLATVLGGMSIFGGSRSNAYAGLIGAMTVTALNKGLLMMSVPTTMVQGIRGLIFLILVFVNTERILTLPSRQQF